MTQEDKELLLRDLSARLPYGVMVKVNDTQGIMDEIDIPNERIFVSSLNPFLYGGAKAHWFTVNGDKIYPYLRPMSSMTEEECKYCVEHFGIQSVMLIGAQHGMIMPMEASPMFIDWLNKKMFAYRTINGKDMFELGLALEAPEGMYEVNEK